MVLVGMGEDHQVQAVVPEGDASPKKGKQPLGIRPAIYQHLPASRGDDEDGIPLAHVQEGDVKPAIGGGEGGGPYTRRCQEGQDHRRPEYSAPL